MLWYSRHFYKYEVISEKGYLLTSLAGIIYQPSRRHSLEKLVVLVLQDLNRRFGNVKVRKVSEADEKDKNDPLKFFNQGFQQIHPMNVMNDQLKVRISRHSYSYCAVISSHYLG